MAHFIFIGGIENSGKTFLAKKFEQEGFKHFNLDTYFERIVKNPSFLLKYLKNNNNFIYQKLITLTSKKKFILKMKRLYKLLNI